jgi:hypothetical protein
MGRLEQERHHPQLGMGNHRGHVSRAMLPKHDITTINMMKRQ